MVNSLIFVLAILNIFQESFTVNAYYSGRINMHSTNTDRSTPDPHVPGENALNVKLLQKILGKRNYDFSWMSINTPSKIYEPANIDIPNNKLLDVLLSFKNLTLTDENGQLINTSKNLESAIRRWMVQQAACKIDYLWKRLDDTHWPSFIKHGVCNSRESCSWPPGMNCRPNDQKLLKILKWTCISDPLGKRWNEFRESIFADKRKRRLRRHKIKRHLSQKRKTNKVIRPKRMKRLVKRYLYRTSKYVSGYLCQWKPIDYTVHQSCTCSCQG
uniref:Noggin like protein n=1 Tax=Dugesia japonica TaxID=6161 RepID=Q8MY69_DUGJA|nr:noggin like protein [Dugesia japonica]